eukprot:39167-Eustigmatos_ZCMA.PRE.1
MNAPSSLCHAAQLREREAEVAAQESASKEIVELPDMVELRDALLEEVQGMDLPPSPLDAIIGEYTCWFVLFCSNTYTKVDAYVSASLKQVEREDPPPSLNMPHLVCARNWGL